MYSNKKYVYTMLLQNSKSYWKFLIGYLLFLLLLFQISNFCYDNSTTGNILTIIYILSLWMSTMWITVFFLKKLFTEKNFLKWNIFKTEKDLEVTQPAEDNSIIPVLSENIDKQFIRYWYDEISRDEKFSVESRILIENTLQMISDLFCCTDKKVLTYVVCNILLRHLKEFRRTLKLKEKTGLKVSESYRYSFSTVLNKKRRDYYIHQTTKNFLVNFIHWELWNSLPCQIVVSIISSKLSYLMDLFTNPDFINYHLLNSLLSEKHKVALNMNQYSYVKIKVADDETEHRKQKISHIVIKEERETQVEVPPKTVEPKEEALEKCNNAVADSVQKTESPQKLEEHIDTSLEPAENIVKVYEPKSATKTWNEALDLESITLGEDPLKNLTDEDDMAEEYDLMKTDSLGAGDATANTLRDIKDFQEKKVNSVVKPMSQATTQALHKFGDLQDEAAGVVEGLFDFGMAGIRKGLKLTGLQENPAQEGAISEQRGKNLLPSPGVKQSIAHKKVKRLSKAELAEECVWVNPLQCTSNFDDNSIEDPAKLENVPSILMESSEYESPDPEYEETADLATTIAKLRSLLQQKSSESTSTTPAASPMISEDNKLAMYTDDVDSFVPSFYKLCAKTATGVFNNTLNTIKTALPVNANEIITYDVETWDYGDSVTEGVSLVERMNKLLHERKDFCLIETAYDAFDSQQAPAERKHLSDLNFQDELDEFECKVPLAKTIVDIICELIAESDTFISQEPFVKFILLVFGLSIDETISTKVEEFLNKIRIKEIPTSDNEEVLTMELDVFVDHLISGIPDALTFMIGHSTLKDALNILVTSIQIKKCNQDVILQVFEFISLRLMEESSKKHSSLSSE